MDQSIIPQGLHQQVSALQEMVYRHAANSSVTADEVERELWTEMLKMGQSLLQQFFTLRHEMTEAQEAIEKDGERYPYAGESDRTYQSIFGTVTVSRYYYWKRGAKGHHPEDEALGLPDTKMSHWIQELLTYAATDMAYEKAIAFWRLILPIQVAKRSTEEMVATHAQDVGEYYAHPQTITPVETDTILVATSDAKGVPMIAKDSPKHRKSNRQTAKKMATVISTYTAAPFKRDINQLIESLLSPETGPTSSSERPEIHHKHIFATLAGQQAAFDHLRKAVEQRDAPHIVHRVALTDGDRGLHNQVATQLPDFTLILDIMHVLGYLWQAADVLFPTGHPLRHTWMRIVLTYLVTDRQERVHQFLHRQLNRSHWTDAQRKSLQQSLTYLQNNRPYMDYHIYLAQGLPISTGVIEGTCRYFVKDRFERSGMHWSYEGAQALLQVRAVALNEDWDAFHRFRRQQAHQRRYGESQSASLPELRLAA